MMGRLESGQERFFYDFCLDEVVPTDPECPDIAFGLCDLGMGFPELGSVSLAELRSVRGKIGLPIERDKFFQASHPLSVYTRAANQAYRIVTGARALEQTACP